MALDHSLPDIFVALEVLFSAGLCRLQDGGQRFKLFNADIWIKPNVLEKKMLLKAFFFFFVFLLSDNCFGKKDLIFNYQIHKVINIL